MNWLFIISLAIGLGRFTIPGHDVSYAGSYEAVAHIWVGALFALSFQKRKAAIIALVLLTAFEGAAFAIFKGWLP